MPHAVMHRLPMSAPDDVSALAAAIAAGTLDPASVVAVLGKTEGNGCVNDFTRGFAVQSLKLLFSRHIAPDRVDAIAFVMSGGTEGGLGPHWLVVEARAGDHAATGPSLAVGVAATRSLLPEEIGRVAQVDAVAAAVAAAMAKAGIAAAEDVHFVQIKCPLLTAERILEARGRGASTATAETLKSMGLSRGASALGVAVALGEVARDAIDDRAIGVDKTLWSGRASTSAGVELMVVEIMVLGMSAAWSGDLAIDHAVMADGIDVEPVRAALRRLGFDAAGQLSTDEQARLRALLVKAEASSTGRLRHHRHTMLDDSDISSTRHARAFVAGALAGVVGHAEIFVSGGAEHQGPDGGGPCAVIARKA
ncbi:ring-opening amidohydrolase [Methyloraptor flagellatus]|uniref:Cyanuric acid amidohydrolase n=1 Tax=Methyloraptor flagellatus TaxID=3162530 RepID=A0AAU7XBH6_9HYPH